MRLKQQVPLATGYSSISNFSGRRASSDPITLPRNESWNGSVRYANAILNVAVRPTSIGCIIGVARSHTVRCRIGQRPSLELLSQALSPDESNDWTLKTEKILYSTVSVLY